MKRMNQEQIDQLIEELKKEYGPEYTSFISKKKARVRDKARMKKIILVKR